MEEPKQSLGVRPGPPAHPASKIPQNPTLAAIDVLFVCPSNGRQCGRKVRALGLLRRGMCVLGCPEYLTITGDRHNPVEPLGDVTLGCSKAILNMDRHLERGPKPQNPF